MGGDPNKQKQKQNKKTSIVSCPKQKKGRLIVCLYDQDSKPVGNYLVKARLGNETVELTTHIKTVTINKKLKTKREVAYVDFGRVKEGTYTVYAEGAETVTDHVKEVKVVAKEEHTISNANLSLVLNFNTVTPKLEILDSNDALLEISYFDDHDPPIDIDPFKVKISIEQSHEQTGYNQDGKLKGGKDKIALFNDQGCTEPVEWTSEELTISNDDLVQGKTFYAKGAAAEKVTLTLSLDDPQRSNVSIKGPVEGAIELTPVNHLTPKLEILQQEFLLDLLGAITNHPIEVKISVKQTHSEVAYEKVGKLTRNGNHIQLFKDKECSDPLFTEGDVATIETEDLLKEGGTTYYLTGASMGEVKLDLSLEDPEGTNLVVNEVEEGLLSGTVLVKLVNTVTPKLELDGAELFIDLLKELSFDPIEVKISVDQSQPDEAGYTKNGKLTHSGEQVEIFWDDQCSKQVEFKEDEAVIENGDLLRSGGLTLYMRGGVSAGNVDLTLTLEDSGQSDVIVKDPVNRPLKVSLVNHVTTKIELNEVETWNISGGGEVTPLEVTVTVEQDHPETLYTGEVTVTRGSEGLKLYTSDTCGTEVAWSDNVLTIPNNEISGKGTTIFTYFLRGDQEGQIDLEAKAGDQSQPTVHVAPAKLQSVTIKTCKTVTPSLVADHIAPPKNHGRTSHKAHAADAAPIKLSWTEDKAQPAYTKTGKLTRTNGNIEVFTDPDCTSPLSFIGDRATISNTDLHAAGTENIYYVRGKTEGEVGLTFELESDEDNSILAAVPVELELGVIPLIMKVHHYQGAPDSTTTMSDEDKAAKGRLLHVQNTDKDHGRAKLVIKQTNSAYWPGAASGYEVVLTADTSNGSGAIKIFDAEKNGSEKKSISQSEITKGDVTLWVEGTAETNDFRHLRLEAGIDNGSGTVLHNGDWATFTVVRIKEVKLKGDGKIQKPKSSGGSVDLIHFEEKNGDHIRAYINVIDDGRKVTVTAELTKALKGVAVHFLLVPDKDNGNAANNGVSFPNSWDATRDTLKQVDKNNSTDTVHVSATTNDQGVAESELTLSQIGGDVFYPGAYIDQDLHSAIYVHGSTAEKTRRKPVLAEKKIVVWRRMWYQITCLKNQSYQDPDDAVVEYGKRFIDVIATSRHEYEDDGSLPQSTIYKKWMFFGGVSEDDIVVIGNHNKAHFFQMYQTDESQPLKGHIVLCDQQWDKGGTTSLKTFQFSTVSRTVTMDKSVFDPPLQGGNLVVYAAYQKNGSYYSIPEGNIIVKKGRSKTKQLVITLPASAPTPTNANKVPVYIQVQGANGPYCGESQKESLLAKYKSFDIPDYNDTVTHEFAHSFRLTSKNPHHDLPANPDHDDTNPNHCKHDTCLMFYESNPNCTHVLCDSCARFLLAADIKKFHEGKCR